MSPVQGLAKSQALLTLSSRHLIVFFALERSSVEHPQTFSLEAPPAQTYIVFLPQKNFPPLKHRIIAVLFDDFACPQPLQTSQHEIWPQSLILLRPLQPAPCCF